MTHNQSYGLSLCHVRFDYISGKIGPVLGSVVKLDRPALQEEYSVCRNIILRYYLSNVVPPNNPNIILKMHTIITSRLLIFRAFRRWVDLCFICIFAGAFYVVNYSECCDEFYKDGSPQQRSILFVLLDVNDNYI